MRRPDLQLMFGQGEWVAEDALVDLFSDVVRFYAATLRTDGTVRGESDAFADEGDVNERIAAAMLGCGEAFNQAAERYWPG